MTIEQHLAAVLAELLEHTHPLDHQKDVSLVVTRRNGMLAYIAAITTEREVATLASIHVNPSNEGSYRAALAGACSIGEPSLFRTRATEAEATSTAEGIHHKVLQ